jgi:cellulose synthase operon protein B
MACQPPQSVGGFQAMLHGIDRTPVGAIRDADESLEPSGDEAEGGLDLFQEWDARLRNESRLSALVDRMRRVGEWGHAKFTDAGDLFRRLDQTRPLEISSQTTLALAQNMLGGANENVWTVLTAPNADALADSVACLVDPRVSRQISGQLSLLDLSRAKIETVPVAHPHFVVTQPLSIGNARLIAAGWLSLNSFYYVGSVLVVGFSLAVATQLFVKHVGRRTS